MRPGGDPFNHVTGRGWVKEHKGQYVDAIFTKGSRVIPMIVEVTGGITPHALAQVSYLARRAKGGGPGRDRTVYGTSRTSSRDFFTHHSQRISLAAILGDAKAIRREIGDRKQELMGGRRASAQA